MCQLTDEEIFDSDMGLKPKISNVSDSKDVEGKISIDQLVREHETANKGSIAKRLYFGIG